MVIPNLPLSELIPLILRILPFWFTLCFGLHSGPAWGQDEVKDAPVVHQAGESYRLRVQNTEYGRVEVSADGGLSYVLIGRVRHAAIRAAAERGADTPGRVLRAGGEGLAFTVGAGRVIKLRPEPRAPTNRAAKYFRLPIPPLPAEIVTNLKSDAGIFGDLTPPHGTPVRLQDRPQTLLDIAGDHALSGDDVFVLIVALPAQGKLAGTEATRAGIEGCLDALARAYAASAVARAHAQGHRVVSGTLTIRARLPEGEPDPIAAVTYTVDDDLLAAQNVGPFSFDWNTRRVPDGEHVVEISALNRNGRLITHARTLIVVNNGKPN
jgi:hypothetical protein